MTLLGPQLFQSISVLYLLSRRRILKRYTIPVDYRELFSGPLDIRTYGLCVMRGMLGTISLILLMVVIVFLYVLL
jgi:hypothetical protein